MPTHYPMLLDQVGFSPDDLQELFHNLSYIVAGTRGVLPPSLLLAMCWYWASDGVGSKDMVVLPYNDNLLLFSRYLQKLVMESIGKEFNLDGKRVNLDPNMDPLTFDQACAMDGNMVSRWMDYFS